MSDALLTESSAERLPPQSIEAEQAILGALLINPETISKVVDVIEPEHFYRKAHQIIYAAIVDLFQESEPIDIVTVSQYLRDQGKLDAIGGRQYLTDLALSIATTANAEYYAKTVNEKALLRNLIKAGTEIVQSCYEDSDADLIVDKAEQLIFSIAQRRAMGALVHIKDVVNESFARIEKRYEQRDALSGIPTGFYDLDEMTSGWQKSDLIIVAARPSMGKCLAFDSEITLADGSIKTIQEIYQSGPVPLLTLHDNYKLGLTQPTVLVDDGIKPVFRITTRLGRQIETTLSHPFLTITGWQPLAALSKGMHIAVPRHMPIQGTVPMRECEIKLLAYLLADGCLTNGKVSFINSNQRLRQEFIDAAGQFGSAQCRVEKSANRVESVIIAKNAGERLAMRKAFAAKLDTLLKTEYATRGTRLRDHAAAIGVSAGTISHWRRAQTVSSAAQVQKLAKRLGTDGLPTVSRCNDKHAIARWCDDLGVYGKGAAEKTIPECVFRLPNDQLSLFLNRLFATDGWACTFASTQVQIGYASVSEKLCRQIQHLLLRFGIIAKLKQRTVKYKGKARIAWQLEVTDAQSVRRFVQYIGIYGKEEAVAKAVAALASKRHQTNVDLVPKEIWNRLTIAKGNLNWPQVAQKAGATGSNLHAGKRALSRGRLEKLSSAIEDDTLQQLATSDVYWDSIVSIEAVGEKQVYDLTIPNTHNFVANDICVHNTAFCLNIAEHCAVEARQPVALFSLEMSKEQLVQRLLCAEARIDANKMRTGFLQSSDWQALAAAMGRLGEAPIFIDDSAAVTVLDVRAKCRRLKAEMKGLGLIVIDYIQLMSGRARSDGNRVQEVSEISRGLKQLARELDCPVIALSQLSRAVEARQNKRPMLSDLRESGAIEQDADIVMFIYRDDYYNQESEKRGEAEIIVAKQRNGPVGTVELLYQASITRFLNKAVTNQYVQSGG